ncbi:MAG: hypothetical protein KAT79_04020 [candidate division Zixibacteria bacterium]|nr:hypothetical protein [candidate division Zixibacteria bacterium]
MTYLFLILIAVAVSLLLLRLRVRVALESDRRVIFVGLGRSGPEFDFAAKEGRFKLLGRSVRSFTLGGKKKAAGKKKSEKKAARKKRSARVRSWRDMVRIGPSVVAASWSFLLDLLRSAVIEELEGEIEAGFDSPDLTGRAFGYYQAALATVPGVAGRFAYVPDWSGASFGGSLRLAIALPLYKLVFRMIILIVRLPLRELIKLAIGKKKGGQDG